MRPKKKILLVGDDEDRVGVLRYVLETHAYRVFTAASAAEAGELLLQAPFERDL